VTFRHFRPDSRDSDIRYLAYGARIRTALRTSLRYVAYVVAPMSSTRITSS
jgi:hypothetical protein